MRRLIRNMKVTTGLLAVIWIAACASVAYTIVTGEAFGSDVTYDVKGRLVSAFVLLVFVGYGVYAGRDLWKLKRELDRTEEEDR